MHDQTKTRHANTRVATGKSVNTLLRRLLPTVAAATLALGVASGVASAAAFGGGDDESPVCESLGCPNGKELCATWAGIVNVPIPIPITPWMPYFGDYFFTPVQMTGTCYESPRY